MPQKGVLFSGEIGMQFLGRQNTMTVFGSMAWGLQEPRPLLTSELCLSKYHLNRVLGKTLHCSVL